VASSRRSRSCGLGPSVSFFFFHAEDGIRDKLVTGVQTCALPISFTEVGYMAGVAVSLDGQPEAGMGVDAGDVTGSGRFDLAVTRSEERRVGKECGSRWGRDH